MRLYCRTGSIILLPAITALAVQGCGWGVDGADRMNSLYPDDAQDAVEDVVSDVPTTDSASPDAAPDTGSDVTDQDAVPDAGQWPDVSYQSIDGRWAVRLVGNAVMTVPIGDRPMNTTDLFIAEYADDGLKLTFCDELIAVEPIPASENGGFSTTTTTKAPMREALAASTIPLTVTGNSVDAQKIVWKWALADSIGETDDLPEEINTTNYPDIDDDGNPGVTIAVSLNLFGSPTEGNRYMAKRAVFDLAEGEMSEDGRWITAAMTFKVDEKVLGADQVLLNNGAAVAPQTDGTKYQFRRVDAAFDCATLVAEHEALFKTAP